MNTPRLLRFVLGAGLLVAGAPLLVVAATVSATGRIVPGSGVIDVFGPSGSRVETVLVQEGEWVEAGAPLARLSDTGLAARRVAHAEARLESLRRNTAADVAVARLRLANAEQEATFAAGRFERIEQSRDNTFVSPDTVEERRLAHQKALTDRAAARATLDRLTTEGATAVTAAEIELAAAQQGLAQSEPRAPLKARVLKARARPGRAVDGSELFKLGDTSTLHVIAEIFETDAVKVRPGQRATISSPGLQEKFTGKVLSVGLMVFRDTLDSLDPERQGTARVVEAVIRLDQVEPLDRLIFLQVEVTIDL